MNQGGGKTKRGQQSSVPLENYAQQLLLVQDPVLPQVLIPSKASGGHQPIRPVAKGMAPKKAHGDCGPIKARDKIPAPTTIRTIRSIFPIFTFMKCLLNKKYVLVAIKHVHCFFERQ